MKSMKSNPAKEKLVWVFDLPNYSFLQVQGLSFAHRLKTYRAIA